MSTFYVFLIFFLLFSFIAKSQSKPKIVPDPRATQGNSVESGYSKYVASIRLKYKFVIFFGINHVCGGSILSADKILTAAHCLCNK